MEHVHIHISGIVQGVGMRPFVYREAMAHQIAGWVLNAGDGVHIEAHACQQDLDAFVRALRDRAPAAARIENLVVTPTADEALTPSTAGTAGSRFQIIASEDETAHTTFISPDIATCPDCLRELFDPHDRRYHYPFINCTNCGPRFTIIRSLPYDRSATSMDAFPMCPDCAREYADPTNRRFHAQPDACFVCGPHLTWREKGTEASACASLEDRTAPEGGHINDVPNKVCKMAQFRGSKPAKVGQNAHSLGDTSQNGALSAAECFETAPRMGKTREESDAIIARCADLLAAGGIVAIKGLGGFHLACNASDEAAVCELRRRKRRSNKPFAVMVCTLEQAEALCNINPTERELLSGTIRPIVLLRRRASHAEHNNNRTADGLAPSVAFRLPELGLMLPYTPLQHLLMAACEQRGIHALVMTSGNISEEPIEVDDETAWKHLVEHRIADALLGNNRAILARYDDSVVRVVDGSVQMVRRARGYAPRPLTLPRVAAQTAASSHAIARPCPADADAPASSHPLCILACGPEQKATIALTREQDDGTATCFLSQHIGDVENGATFDAWHAATKRLEELFDLDPTVLACDLHPSYLPSQWAREQARITHKPLIEVQHHHAHIASVIAESAARGEHDATQPVIGIAFDGTGAGAQHVAGETGAALKPDGTIWGSEFLIADLLDYKRAAHLSAWRLPGGAASVRDARRNAFSLLVAHGLLHHTGANALVQSLSDEEHTITATMIERGINSPLTSSMGRFLDACAALLGICEQATYEGEPAILLEAAAQRVRGYHVTPLPSFDLASDSGQEPQSLVIDPAPVLNGILERIASGEEPERIALAIHDAVANMAVEIVMHIAAETDIRTIALSGGVFMNRLLLSTIAADLAARGMTVLLPHSIPFNDGCISYGQAAVARAQLLERNR